MTLEQSNVFGVETSPLEMKCVGLFLTEGPNLLSLGLKHYIQIQLVQNAESLLIENDVAFCF